MLLVLAIVVLGADLFLLRKVTKTMSQLSDAVTNLETTVGEVQTFVANLKAQAGSAPSAAEEADAVARINAVSDKLKAIASGS